MFVARKRATLLFEAGPARDPYQHHLVVILTNPFGPAKQVVFVPICSIRNEFHDDTCLVSVGEHSFLQHASYVDYSHARTEVAAMIEDRVTKGFFVPKEDASEALFQRVLAGVFRSRRTKPFVKTDIRAAETEHAPKKK